MVVRSAPRLEIGRWVVAKAVVKDIEKDRADSEEWLRSAPTSYLASVDRQDFGEKKTLTVGRAVDNDLRIDDVTVAGHQATVEGDAFQTYSVGRYIDVKKLPNGNYLLDFNLAYNPACSVSDHYNCPIPSKANTLPVAIRAGEMDSHYH